MPEKDTMSVQKKSPSDKLFNADDFSELNYTFYEVDNPA
jgi:hypothetical protein